MAGKAGSPAATFQASEAAPGRPQLQRLRPDEAAVVRNAERGRSLGVQFVLKRVLPSDVEMFEGLVEDAKVK